MITQLSNLVLSLFTPYNYELREYMGYDITKFKDNIRFLEMVVNRDGDMGGLCPLYFDGAVCQFSELPLPNNHSELHSIYSYLNKIRGINSAKVLLGYSQKKKKKSLLSRQRK